MSFDNNECSVKIPINQPRFDSIRTGTHAEQKNYVFPSLLTNQLPQKVAYEQDHLNSTFKLGLLKSIKFGQKKKKNILQHNYFSELLMLHLPIV